MSEATEVLKGSPDECAKCGAPRKRHDLIGKCPGERYGYFRSKYDYKGELETEHTDEPVCPWCGVIYEIDDYYELYSEDENEVECGHCGKPFRSSASISYAFTTKRIDVEAENAKHERMHAKREKRRLERLARCEKFTPGMRVRARDDITNYNKGRTGTVSNEELNPGNPFVHVDLDPTEDRPATKRTLFDGDELEAI